MGVDKSTKFSYVSVDGANWSLKTLLHMLFHILGRYHEHERVDREKYIDFIEGNVMEGRCNYNFYIGFFVCEQFLKQRF